MSTVQNIAKNTILLVAANIVNLAMGFIINIYIARYFDVDKFGIVNWAINLSTIFTLLTDLGIGMFIAIEIPRYPDRLKKYLGNAFSMKLLLSLFALAGIFMVASLGGVAGDERTVLYIIALYVVIMAIAQLFQYVFQAFQKVEHIAVCQVTNSVVLAIGTIVVVTMNLGIVAFSMVYLAAGLTVLGYTLLVTARFFTWPTLECDTTVWKYILSIGIPLSVASVFSYLYFKLDIQLIEMLLPDGKVAVGYYTAAFKLIEAAIVLPSMYNTVIYPLISQYFHKNDANLDFLFRKSIKYLYMIAAPLTAGAIIMAPSIIYFLYTDKYAPSIGVLQILAMGMFFIYLNSVPSIFLSATDKQMACVKVTGICLIVNIALNLLLIPSWGILGSAFSMVVTQFVWSVVAYMIIKREGYQYMNMTEAVKIAICTFMMSIYVYYFQSYNLAFVIISAVVIYSVLIILSGAFTNEDISLILSIINKNPAKDKVESLEAR